MIGAPHTARIEKICTSSTNNICEKIRWNSGQKGQVDGDECSLEKSLANLRPRLSAQDKGLVWRSRELLNRYFDYRHMQKHGGQPKTVNDISAGNATFSEKVRAEFDPVVVFVLSPDNAALADQCLGKYIFTHRVDGAEEVDNVAEDSAYIVFTANLMHYCDQQKAVAAIVEQLGPCGREHISADCACGSDKKKEPKHGWRSLEELVGDRQDKGVWPLEPSLATRR